MYHTADLAPPVDAPLHLPPANRLGAELFPLYIPFLYYINPFFKRLYYLTFVCIRDDFFFLRFVYAYPLRPMNYFSFVFIRFFLGFYLFCLFFYEARRYTSLVTGSLLLG